MTAVLENSIHIDSELQAWIDPLSADEYAQLEASILEEGCRDPLVIWGNYFLLDGHNRYQICTRHNIAFKTVEKSSLTTKNDARIWMFQNQLARRNVTDYARTVLTLKLKPLMAERSASRMRAGKADPVQISVQGTGRTRDVIAKAAEVSHDTVRKVELIEENAAPEVKFVARAGAISIHAAAQIATLPRNTQAQIFMGGIANIKKAAVEIRTINPKVDEQQSCLAGLSSVDPRQSSEDQAMIARPNGQPGRHPQVQGILASIFMGLDSSDPTQKTLENTIWVAQDLLEQAEDATALLGLCDFECPNECKECK